MRTSFQLSLGGAHCHVHLLLGASGVYFNGLSFELVEFRFAKHELQNNTSQRQTRNKCSKLLLVKLKTKTKKPDILLRSD